MNPVNILRVRIDPLTHEDLMGGLREVLNNAADSEIKIIATVYSEFVVAAQQDDNFKNILNSANINIADGIGILWAASFLSRKTADLFELIREFLTSAWQTAFNQSKIKDVLPERLAGADLVWDICKLARELDKSIYFLGAHGDVVSPVKEKFPNLKIAGRYEGSPDEGGLAQKISEANADILLVAFDPIAQYRWLDENRTALSVKLAMGVGGSFDYIIGHKKRAGNFWQAHGLEWLHRLITQPWRLKRMWNAIIVFSWLVFKEKWRATTLPNK